MQAKLLQILIYPLTHSFNMAKIIILNLLKINYLKQICLIVSIFQRLRFLPVMNYQAVNIESYGITF